MPDSPGNRRHELNGRCTGADHRHAFACQRIAVVPGRRVEHVPLEGFHTCQLRERRATQLTGATDQQRCTQDAAILLGHVPQRRAVIKLGGHHFDAETNVLVQPVLVSAMPQIGVNLGLGREHPAPVRVRLKRKRIQVRRYVARGAGVTVVPPDTADILFLLQDHKVLHTGLLQGNGHADTGKTAANDDGAQGCCRLTAGSNFMQRHKMPHCCFQWWLSLQSGRTNTPAQCRG
ncbi:hypothetical protein D3C84_305120 [compost metagenome]